MLADVMAKGYLPEELPPCFTSENFSAAIMNNRAALPRGFNRPQISQLCNFSLARAGNARFRRQLSLVNPINFYAISNIITTNWAIIDGHISTSALSKSKPVNRPNGRRALSPITYERRDLVPMQAAARSSARALLVADISTFYHSIYTHSIPWALHTKAYAKANRGAGILGNDLDLAVRNSQHSQTIGIPIGPDTSLVIAECILAAVEKSIHLRIPLLTGLRFVDDFELCFPDIAQADHALAVLQQELLEFELRLNPRKTAIHTPPIAFEPEWVGELRRFHIRNNSGQAGDLVSYFDHMTKFLLEHPNEHVSKYGLQRMKTFTPRPENLRLCTSLLCQIGVAEPGSIREVVESILFLHGQGFQIDKNLVGETLNTVIKNSAPLGHHYEVSWCLWGAIRLGIGISPDSVSKLGGDNSITGILSLDAHSRGLAPNLDITKFQTRMTQQDLREDQWLLSYEANVKNWLPSIGGRTTSRMTLISPF
jgi:hypothetical protein